MLLQSIMTTSLVFIVFIVAMLGIYYFISRKNIKKQHEHFTNLHQSLHSGHKVVLSNGIYGVVKRIGEQTAEVEIAKGVVITVSRYAISEIISK